MLGSLESDGGCSLQKYPPKDETDRQRHHPGNDDTASDPPGYRTPVLHRAHPNNGAVNCVRGADRYPKSRCDLNNCPCCRLSSKSMSGVELDQLEAHRLDDPEAAGGRTQSHRERSRNNHPQWDIERVIGSICEKGKGKNAHGFLSIVAPMAIRPCRRRTAAVAGKRVCEPWWGCGSGRFGR